MITSKKGKEMIKTISPIYSYNETMQAIIQSIGMEADYSEELSEDVLKQLFVQTATWGLDFWEDAVNLPTNNSLSYEHRRGKIIAILQSRISITPEKMELIIKNYTGASVSVIENVSDYKFKIEADVDIESINDLSFIVNDIKPAHLSWLASFIVKIINKTLFETRIKHKINSYFGRRGNVLDGEWLLNGFVNLDNSYEPITVRSINRITSRNKNLFDNLKLHIRDTIKNSNAHNARSSFLFSTSFWFREGIFLDGEWILDSNNEFNTLELHKKKDIEVNIKSKMNLNVVNLEKFKSERIIIKKNWWQLGGQHSLGEGSLLSAEIREEVI